LQILPNSTAQTLDAHPINAKIVAQTSKLFALVNILRFSRKFCGVLPPSAPPPQRMFRYRRRPLVGFENFWIFLPTLTPLRRLKSRRFPDFFPRSPAREISRSSGKQKSKIGILPNPKLLGSSRPDFPFSLSSRFLCFGTVGPTGPPPRGFCHRHLATGTAGPARPRLPRCGVFLPGAEEVSPARPSPGFRSAPRRISPAWVSKKEVHR
jgi:hypothetical protein